MPLIALADGHRTFAKKYGPRRAVCPHCDAEMIAKTGEIVTHHWAHHNATQCVGEPETQWHLQWKLRCSDPDRIEVPRGNRRADALTPYGWAVEFQHSPLSIDEIYSRQLDWDRKMIWVFDTLEAVAEDRLWYWQKPEQHCVIVRWAWSKPHVIAASVPTFLHVGDQVLMIGRWYEKHPNRPIHGYGWTISVDDFVDHVINGLNPPQAPRFRQPLDPRSWAWKACPDCGQPINGPGNPRCSAKLLAHKGAA